MNWRWVSVSFKTARKRGYRLCVVYLYSIFLRAFNDKTHFRWNVLFHNWRRTLKIISVNRSFQPTTGVITAQAYMRLLAIYLYQNDLWVGHTCNLFLTKNIVCFAFEYLNNLSYYCFINSKVLQTILATYAHGLAYAQTDIQSIF